MPFARKIGMWLRLTGTYAPSDKIRRAPSPRRSTLSMASKLTQWDRCTCDPGVGATSFKASEGAQQHKAAAAGRCDPCVMIFGSQMVNGTAHVEWQPIEQRRGRRSLW